MKSILPPEMKGVMFITGRRGVGKSFLAAQAESPDNIVFFDGEQKGSGIHEQLKFGAYHPITELAAGKGAFGIWDVVLKIISEMQKDRFTVAIFDNVSPLELSMKSEAVRNASKYAKEFSLVESNITGGRYGGANAVVNFLVTDKVCAPLHAKGVKLIIVTSHVKSPWVGGAPVPNKWNAKGADRWQELSICSLVLVAGEHAPIPAALVQKEQLGSIVYSEELGEFAIQRRLPLRIPRCTFAEIKRYLREPANLANPERGESPTADEYYQFSEELSKEQLSIVQATQAADARENASLAAMTAANNGDLLDTAVELTDEIKARIIALRASGKTGTEVRDLLNAEGLSFPLATILRVK